MRGKNRVQFILRIGKIRREFERSTIFLDGFDKDFFLHERLGEPVMCFGGVRRQFKFGAELFGGGGRLMIVQK